MAWTPYQQAAIDERNANILVSAAAGSGKTAVLTQRVFKRIVGNEVEAPINLDRFLIVTFTSAAAQEMKERIAQEINQEIERLQELVEGKGEGEDKRAIEVLAHLENQLTLLPKASISTVHSFCLKTVKNYFNLLEIDPNIKVGNEAELELMKQELLEELLEEAFETGDEAFIKLADAYASVRGMAPLVEMILEVHTFSKSTIFPNQWLESMANELEEQGEGLGKSRWDRVLIESMLTTIADLQHVYEKAIELTKEPDGPTQYEAVLEEEYTQLQSICEILSIDTLVKGDSEEVLEATEKMLQAILRMNFGKLSAAKGGNAELKEQVKGYRELAKKAVEKLKNKAQTLMDPTLRHKTKEAGQIIKILVEWVEKFEERFQEAKKEKAVVDYSDLEHMCLKLLIEQVENEAGEKEIRYTDVARELAEFYEEIYMDEYQDTNEVQETLMRAIAESKEDGPTRFMVGDMKQSIYRFRLANPLIFGQKYETFDKYQLNQKEIQGEEKVQQIERQRPNICIDLSENFRSRAGVLEATNDIFDQIMSKEVGELVYDDNARLKVGNMYSEGNPENYEGSLSVDTELHVVEVDKGETEEDEEDLSAIEVEAQMVAELIHNILRGEGNPKVVYDKTLKAYRKVEQRDIVILLRSVAQKGEIFEKALIERGIDAYADINGGFFEATEIQTMLALLRVLDNPRQDIPLLSVLRSPIVGLDFDELLEIRKYKEDGDFYTALMAYIEADKASPLLTSFYEMMHHYRERVPLVSVEQLLADLYGETRYYRYVGMLPMGAKKKANLKMLKKYAETFEASIGIGVFQFLQYMEKLERTGAKVAEAKLVGEQENLVRIMTIHKSKGLEFPIVFVSNANKKFNNKDTMRTVLLHNELGFGPKYTDQETSVLYETVPFLAIKERIESENRSEEMRVLYVALTRAKEKLYITGTTKDFDKDLKEWSQFANRKTKSILPLGVKKSPTYMKWVGMSLMGHREGAPLREQVGTVMAHTFEGDSTWRIQKWLKSQLTQTKKEAVEQRRYSEQLLENWETTQSYSSQKEVIYERLNYSYEHREATFLPTKVAVSDLKKKQQEAINPEKQLFKEVLKPIPKFIQGQEVIEGAAKGTLIHGIFEHLDLMKYTNQLSIKEQLYQLVREGKITEDALQVVDLERLEQVAHTPIMARMKNARHVWKEKAFVYQLSAKEVDATYPEEETVLLQGVVDNCFIEEDGLVIVDYKTDYINLYQKECGIAQIKERYSLQLDLYGKALSEISGWPVKEKIIYLYSINEWINL